MVSRRFSPLLRAALAVVLPLIWIPVRAQEASSEVTGFIEISVAPGKFESMAPLFLPTATASGAVTGVVNAGQITPAWLGILPDPPETGVWLPRTGLALGRPLYGSPVAASSDWNYADVFQGVPFGGPAEQSLLRVGDRFSVVPFWTVDELAAEAGAGLVHVSAVRATADTFRFGEQSVWAAKPDGDDARWVTGSSDDPAGEDAGGSVIPDVTGGAGYLRSTSATAARRLFVLGMARATPVPFRIVPTPAGASSPVLNPLFRPDGRELSLSNLLGLFTQNARTGLVGGAKADVADKLVIWSPVNQQWEQFYYQTSAPAGWKPLLGGTVSASGVKVRPGASFFVVRPSTLPELVVKLPAVSQSVAVNTKLFSQIIDTDKDRLPDEWERANGSSTLAMLPGADDDGDGLTNLQESLLGGDPRVFDHPVRPIPEVRESGGSREVWVKFATAAGRRYRVERRVAGATSWTMLGAMVAGDGLTKEVKDSLALPEGDRIPRFYRVVAITWADSDGDLVSDWEETSVYGTDPFKADSDLDGTKDGAELRAKGRDPLEYYDGRTLAFTIDPASDGQVARPGEWLRQAITFRVTSSLKPLANAPVVFALTNGTGLFAAAPGDSAQASPVLRMRTDSSGYARAFFKAGTASGPIQGRLAARVITSGGLVQLFSGGFICHVSENLTIPSTGLVRWFRPDSGLSLKPGSSEVTSWQALGATGSADASSGSGPVRTIDAGRPWLKFTGLEKLGFGAILPDNNFSAFFVAVPTGKRTESPANVGASGVNAGGSGQLYLLAGPTVPGESIVIYDPPAKPGAKAFSTWEQTDFRLHPYYLNGPAGEAYWNRTRPYDFPVAPGRYDITDGYRYTPLPAGIHRDPGTDNVKNTFVKSLGTYFANYETTYERTSITEIVAFQQVVGYERFYRVSASSWKGNSGSSAYGGVARMQYSKLGEVGFGLSVGSASSGAFELGQYWKPATTGPGAHLASQSGVPSGTILGTLRVIDRLPSFDVGGKRRFSGANAYRKAPVLLAPRFLGGWDASGSGFQGRLGDVLLYDRDLSDEERRAVEDSLAAAYRGVYSVDRDGDGLRDWWETAFFGNSSEKSSGDLDGDGVNNLTEQTWGTNPAMADTDGDGLNDRAELQAKTNPLTWDTDFDGLPDATDLLPKDSKDGRIDLNSNGIPDGVDRLLANRTLTDSDSDGLCDLIEAAWLLTDPSKADTDGDGVSDTDEVIAGTDPLVP